MPFQKLDTQHNPTTKIVLNTRTVLATASKLTLIKVETFESITKFNVQSKRYETHTEPLRNFKCDDDHDIENGTNIKYVLERSGLGLIASTDHDYMDRKFHELKR